MESDELLPGMHHFLDVGVYVWRPIYGVSEKPYVASYGKHDILYPIVKDFDSFNETKAWLEAMMLVNV